MRLLAGLACLALSLTAAADPPKPAARSDAKPAAACKRKVVGRGLDRKVVCVFEQSIVVHGSNRPAVVYVHPDGKAVTGRPKSDDRLAGLSHTLPDH
ncbi:MAG TPA: hypothetical protein VLX92_01900 [Kofleriaceae bacterium]|nr:hypothetical protein [Kofleriaceae bacterium]